MADELRAGVIGAGVFGGYHANKYAELPDVRLVGVYDLHPERAAEVAGRHRATGFASLDALLAEVEVLTIASPAVAHAEAALAALKAGAHVYVEKPIAVSVTDAERVRAAAALKGVVVACGHQERVVFQAMGLLDIPERPLRLEAVRHGPPSPRSRDVSVVLDLMIHDLDLALALTDADPLAVEAEGEGAEGLDRVRAEVDFDDGFTCVFDASRIAEGRRRTMKVVFPSGEVEIDFVARTFRNTTPFALDEAFAETPAGKDSLRASVEGFLATVRWASPRPVVNLAEAARALDLALAVERAAT